MAKAHSPLRLEAQLVEQATLAGKQLHRSTAEQIEYWANLGQTMARILSPDSLLQVYSGLARIRVEPLVGPTVDPDAVFGALEDARQAGTLTHNVTSSTVRYQASSRYPGLLEQISPDGVITIGRFQEGDFIPLEDNAA